MSTIHAHNFYKRFTPNGIISHRPITSSTKLIIKEAKILGIEVDHIEGSEVFELKYKDKIRYFYYQVPGTNSALGYFITSHKRNTRNLLKENGISIPNGYSIQEKDSNEVKRGVFNALKKPLVVKPNKGTQGKGITMLISTFSEYTKAIEKALASSNEDNPWVVVEEQLSGYKEYRVLATRDKVIGILNRVPANVIGNGTSTVKELIKIKNSDPRRGDCYDHPPLFKIIINEDLKENLRRQDLDLEFIPKKNDRIFLRTVSNISQGGDSIDFTDKAHESVKNICLKAVNAIPGLVIVGIDFMTKDITLKQENGTYAILEINVSAGLDIHDYPYEGTNRKAGIEFLRILFDEDFK